MNIAGDKIVQPRVVNVKVYTISQSLALEQNLSDYACLKPKPEKKVSYPILSRASPRSVLITHSIIQVKNTTHLVNGKH